MGQTNKFLKQKIKKLSNEIKDWKNFVNNAINLQRSTEKIIVEREAQIKQLKYKYKYYKKPINISIFNIAMFLLCIIFWIKIMDKIPMGEASTISFLFGTLTAGLFGALAIMIAVSK